MPPVFGKGMSKKPYLRLIDTISMYNLPNRSELEREKKIGFLYVTRGLIELIIKPMGIIYYLRSHE